MNTCHLRDGLPRATLLACVFSAGGFAATESTAASLVDAARAGDIAEVRAVLAGGADVNAAGSDGTTPLLWAAYESSPELVALLLASGAEPNVANAFGVTPLLQASRYGDVATLRALLDAGADLTKAVREGETPLMAAARAGSVGGVQLLIERGADVNAVETLEEQTALMWAVAEGHLPVVDALMRAGADPNRQSRVSTLKTRSMRTDFPSGGLTALMWAARNGDAAVVRRLVDAGGDLNLKNGDGSTALMLAIVNDRYDMAVTLLELGAVADEGALYYAIDMRDAPTDWRARDGSRLRADHRNEITGIELIERLLAAGADPDKPFFGQMHSASMCCDSKGYGTPLFRAAVAADVDALKLLVAHEADLEWTPQPVAGMPPLPFGDYTGLTPLMAAVNGGKGQLMAGGPGDVRDGLLGVFREPGNRNPGDAVKVLLEAGANPNALSSKGDTALHLAAFDGRLEPIRALIAGGADFRTKDKAGLTALEMVERMGPRTLNEIAAMVGIIDDGASPADTAKFLREQIANRERAPR